MRLNEVLATALYSSAVLLGQVRAQDSEDEIDASSTEVDTSTTSAIERPTFTVKLHSDRRRKPVGQKVQR